MNQKQIDQAQSSNQHKFNDMGNDLTAADPSKSQIKLGEINLELHQL
jgi:hypothetical protein